MSGARQESDSEGQATRYAELFTRFARAASRSDPEFPMMRVERPEIVAPKAEVYLADIEAAVGQFARTMILSREFGPRVPVVVSNSELPLVVSLASIVAHADVDRDTLGLSYRDVLIRQVQRALEIPPFSHGKIHGVTADDAFFFFETHLTQFLFARFEARESDISEAPGRLFEVRTRTQGLRVHYSTAFEFDPYNVFGSPTSPVKAWIQPGNYYFGAVGPGVALQFDLEAKYDVMRVSHAQLEI